ncbi:hypothetical protein DL95DRAFT_414498 [Leptodontidium sp. 2 PMI_412]|nr:hypothetical protein DL95DRAFT_414498 [Leptodontidium sp. 2 PMI_412]
MAKLMEPHPPEPSWLRISEAKVLESQVEDISAKLGILNEKHPGLDVMSELLESLNSLVDCVYELYGPAGMREIDTPQLAEYHSQESNARICQLSNQLDEARRRIDIQGRGSAEERKHFSEYKAGYEEAKERLASENMDLRLKRDILNAQNQKLQTDVANEATNRKGLQVKIEGMHKELQGCRTTVEEAEKEILAQSNRAEEAEKKTRVQENTIQILASMCMKFRERRDNSESFKTSQADASGVCEINKLRQQLDETRRQLSAAQSRASSLQLENESLDGTTGSFAAQVGFEGPPTSPVASRRILPRVRPRKESFSQSQSNTTSGEVSSAFQTLAWPRATLSLLSENDVNDCITPPRLTAQISSGMESASISGTSNLQNSAGLNAPTPQRSQSLGVPRRDSNWIQPSYLPPTPPLPQVSDGYIPEGYH